MFRHFVKIVAPILSLTLFLSACATPAGADEPNAAASSEAITVTHELGEAKVGPNPERVIVFDYGLLDLLDHMDVEIIGLPKASLPGFLNGYQDDRYEDVGTLKEPDFEKVFELKPDLILISTRTQAAFEELSQIAPTVYLAVDNSDYLGSVEKNAKLLAGIFGKTGAVDEGIRAMNEKAAQIRDKAEEAGENALIILANDGSLSAYGKVSRFGIIHSALGFAEADEGIEESTHGQNVTYEYILEKDPAHLFVIDRAQVVGGETDAGTAMDNEIIKGTQASMKGQIHYLDPEVWYITSGGFTGTGMMLEEIAKILQ